MARGLLLSDSLMKDLPDKAYSQLVQGFDLDDLKVIPYPGYTTAQLIGEDGVVHKLLKSLAPVTHLFLCAGANDFNRATEVTSERKCNQVAEQIQNFIHFFCSMYPHIKLFFLPIPMRQVAQIESVKNKFPDTSGSKDWIKITNYAISLFQHSFRFCECHSNCCSQVKSPPIDVWKPLLCKDGLHLTEKGKIHMIKLLRTCIPRKSFFVYQSFPSFPPLPS